MAIHFDFLFFLFESRKLIFCVFHILPYILMGHEASAIHSALPLVTAVNSDSLRKPKNHTQSTINLGGA